VNNVYAAVHCGIQQVRYTRDGVSRLSPEESRTRQGLLLSYLQFDLV
jgi:hypothetical protein